MAIFASNQKLCNLCSIPYTDFRNNIHNFLDLMQLEPFRECGDENDTIWSYLCAEVEIEVWQDISDILYGLIGFIENKGKYYEDVVAVIKKNEDKFER